MKEQQPHSSRIAGFLRRFSPLEGLRLLYESPRFYGNELFPLLTRRFSLWHPLLALMAAWVLLIVYTFGMNTSVKSLLMAGLLGSPLAAYAMQGVTAVFSPWLLIPLLLGLLMRRFLDSPLVRSELKTTATTEEDIFCFLVALICVVAAATAVFLRVEDAGWAAWTQSGGKRRFIHSLFQEAVFRRGAGDAMIWVVLGQAWRMIDGLLMQLVPYIAVTFAVAQRRWWLTGLLAGWFAQVAVSITELPVFLLNGLGDYKNRIPHFWSLTSGQENFVRELLKLAPSICWNLFLLCCVVQFCRTMLFRPAVER